MSETAAAASARYQPVGCARAIACAIAVLWLGASCENTRAAPPQTITAAEMRAGSVTTSNGAAPLPHPQISPLAETNLPTMEVGQAVMVTVDLSFGPDLPSVAQALQDVERRSAPEDGQGRTFAIIDAYGAPTPDGKLRVSMHVSTERPGVGTLVFRRTGATLWKTRITPATHPPASSFAGKNLFIMLADAARQPHLLDGANVSTSILDATVRDLGVRVSDFWAEGVEREATFFYSACGCPVKVLARRVGNRTVRSQELPVIFPDDPAVVAVISRLMGWN